MSISRLPNIIPARFVKLIFIITLLIGTLFFALIVDHGVNRKEEPALKALFLTGGFLGLAGCVIELTKHAWELFKPLEVREKDAGSVSGD